MSENVLPVFPSMSLFFFFFPSMSFMVSCLVFKCLNHFEFIFVYSVRECSNFIDLHAAV